MKRLQIPVIALIAAALSAAVVQVKGASTTNVTSHLLIPADSAAPVFFSDVSRSGTDTYVTTAGRNPVGSLIQSGGDWQLDTQSSARAVWLDLGNPSLPFNAQYVHSLMTTHCGTTNTMPVGALTGGQSTTCGMSFRINWERTAPSITSSISIQRCTLVRATSPSCATARRGGWGGP